APREIFFAEKEIVPLEKSVGRICAEEVTFYPPGIPILNLGEKITPQVVNQILELKNLGGRTLTDANFIKVI
ncbi:MAG: arginine decarboxylase, partial [Selenomonadaceae bacterium]|nr:arginine decarboxylase [Selenomonadaceae bacterium]